MKALLIALFVTASFSVMAKPIAPCSEKGIKHMNESIHDWMTEEDTSFKEVYFIKNLQGQTLGYYIWGENYSVVAETCESFDTDDIVAASTWHYWGNEESKISTNPMAWKKGMKLEISDDEGFLYLTVTTLPKNNTVRAQIKVRGWNHDNEDVFVRKETVIITK